MLEFLRCSVYVSGVPDPDDAWISGVRIDFIDRRAGKNAALVSLAMCPVSSKRSPDFFLYENLAAMGTPKLIRTWASKLTLLSLKQTVQ